MSGDLTSLVGQVFRERKEYFVRALELRRHSNPDDFLQNVFLTVLQRGTKLKGELTKDRISAFVGWHIYKHDTRPKKIMDSKPLDVLSELENSVYFSLDEVGSICARLGIKIRGPSSNQRYKLSIGSSCEKLGIGRNVGSIPSYDSKDYQEYHQIKGFELVRVLTLDEAKKYIKYYTSKENIPSPSDSHIELESQRIRMTYSTLVKLLDTETITALKQPMLAIYDDNNFYRKEDMFNHPINGPAIVSQLKGDLIDNIYLAQWRGFLKNGTNNN